jgi:phosphoserine aminotransferase
MPERSEIRNLAAGPSPLPTPVLEKAAKGLINYNNTGMGICELSHRSKDFKAVIEGAEGRSIGLIVCRGSPYRGRVVRWS